MDLILTRIQTKTFTKQFFPHYSSLAKFADNVCSSFKLLIRFVTAQERVSSKKLHEQIPSIFIIIPNAHL